MIFRRSIHWQIQLWYGVLLAVVTSMLLVLVYLREREARIRTADTRLMQDLIWLLPYHIPIAGQSEPPLAYLLEPANTSHQHHGENHREFEQTGNYIVTFRPDGSLAYKSPGAAEIAQPVGKGMRTVQQWNGTNRELLHVTPHGFSILLGTSGKRIEEGLHLLVVQLILLGFVLLALGLVVGYWIVQRAMRPVREITHTAQKIADGKISTRVPAAEGAPELQDLAAVLNTTFDRLQTYYQNQARFTADASHELGNPVSIVISQTQLALERPRTPEEYVEALRACRRAGQRMRFVTRDLLALAGYESGGATRIRNRVDVVELLNDAVEVTESLADARRAKITVNAESVVVQVHSVGFGQALINLIENALRHNPEGVSIELRARREGNRAVIEVENSGEGIPEKHLPHIFERFYRVDPHKHSSPQGTGLGLAITKAIIQSHDGTISVKSEPGKGVCFRIELPLKS